MKDSKTMVTVLKIKQNGVYFYLTYRTTFVRLDYCWKSSSTKFLILLPETSWLLFWLKYQHGYAGSVTVSCLENN